MRDRTKRKRYLLLSGDRPVDPETRKEIVRLLMGLYPFLEERKMVWVQDSLIIRTDQLTLPDMKRSLVLTYGGVSLTPRLSSGSISKLKRAVEQR